MQLVDGLTIVGLAIALLALASVLVYGAQRINRRRNSSPQRLR